MDFSSGKSVELFWSKDRSIVAANSRDNNGRLMEVYIYQVGSKTLKPITVPQLTDEQAGELKEVQPEIWPMEGRKPFAGRKMARCSCISSERIA